MIQTAIKRTGQYRRLWVNLYLVSLVSGLLLLISPAMTLLNAANLTAIEAAADGADLWHLTELVLLGNVDTVLGRAVSNTITTMLQSTALNLVLGILAFSFFLSAYLRGGTLARLSDTGKSFHPSARRYVLSLLFLQAFHFGLILITVIVTTAVAGAVGIQQYMLTILVAGLSVLPLWIVWFELSAVALIQHNTTNPFRALSQGFRTLFRRPLALIGFYMLALLLMAGFQWVMRFAVQPNLPATWWPLVLVVQQVGIFGRIGLRLFRYAGALQLVSPPDKTETLAETEALAGQEPSFSVS
ncbi:MAG: hypothetical protein ACPG8W_14390 [Candidatus Promineifilaceae bacterium]